MRVYVPATLSLLRRLVDERQLFPLGGNAFALTAALREAYASGDTEELEYAALREAARASLRLLATDESDKSEEDREHPRRVVLSVDVEDVTPRPDLDHAVVKVSAAIEWTQVAAVHVDTAEAEEAVKAAAAVVDAADLGDVDAEFQLGEAEDHELAWYAPQEVPFLLELM